MKIPSSHQIGDIVIFEPRLHLIDASENTTSDPDPAFAKVVGVGFNTGKVFYDLAVKQGEDEYYEINPLRGVDSFMVLPKH